MRNLKKIIKDCGGPDRIEEAAGVTPGTSKPRLSHWAVRKWLSNGIPERHWPLVQQLSGATVEELYSANRVTRRPSA